MKKLNPEYLIGMGIIISSIGGIFLMHQATLGLG